MTLFLIMVALGLVVFWRQAVAALAAGVLVLLVLGLVKVAELLHLAGI